MYASIDLAAALASGLGALVLSALGPAYALPQLTPALAVERINPSPTCAQQRVVGTCWCGPVPCGWRVTQFVPTTFIETVRTPGETLVGAFAQALSGGMNGLGLAGPTRQTHENGRDSSFEAHIFSMPERLVQIRNGCFSCKTSSAQLPASGSADSWGGGASCGDAAIVMQGLAGLAGSQAFGAGTTMPLHYASESDAFNWRTGCRDIAARRTPSHPGFNCNSLTDGFGPNTPLDPAYGSGCIGRWGPLFPRQMRTRGPEDRLASAITAYRALSIARTDLASYPYPVDTTGLFQQAYPGVSTCLPVGASPSLPGDLLRSPDGAYAWIYWRLTTCCIPFDIESNC